MSVVSVFAVLTLLLASAQKPEFEAATLKVVPRLEQGTTFYPPKGGPGTDDPTTWRYQNARLPSLIGLAYDKKFYEITTPEWAGQDIFSINAKLPPGTTKEDFRLMLRNLLEDRFGLRVHTETRQIPGYVLTIAKGGPKFKTTVPDAPPLPPTNEPMRKDENGYPVFPRGSAISMGIMMGKARFHLTNQALSNFAEQLSGQLRGPVRDETGLTGKYDLDIYWDARTTPPPDGDLGPDLIQAVKEQLGLTIEAKKVPVEFLVVDHAERVPKEN